LQNLFPILSPFFPVLFLFDDPPPDFKVGNNHCRIYLLCNILSGILNEFGNGLKKAVLCRVVRFDVCSSHIANLPYIQAYLVYTGNVQYNKTAMNISLLRQSIRNAAAISFSRSGGPGGQNVNKVNTKVTLRLRLADIAGLSEAELERAKELLANRITTDNEIVINADEERSQRTNLERAYFRLEALITAAARLPKHRRPTKPSRQAREDRLQTKHLHSRKKAQRQRRPDEE
jgi:ribosome-associated protein